MGGVHLRSEACEIQTIENLCLHALNDHARVTLVGTRTMIALITYTDLVENMPRCNNLKISECCPLSDIELDNTLLQAFVVMIKLDSYQEAKEHIIELTNKVPLTRSDVLVLMIQTDLENDFSQCEEVKRVAMQLLKTFDIPTQLVVLYYSEKRDEYCMRTREQTSSLLSTCSLKQTQTTKASHNQLPGFSHVHVKEKFANATLNIHLRSPPKSPKRTPASESAGFSSKRSKSAPDRIMECCGPLSAMEVQDNSPVQTSTRYEHREMQHCCSHLDSKAMHSQCEVLYNKHNDNPDALKQAISRQLECKLFDILEKKLNLIKNIKRKRGTDDSFTALDKLEYEIESVCKHSYSKKSAAILDRAEKFRLSPTLQRDILNVEGVHGCGTLYNRLHIDILFGRDDHVKEEVRRLINKHQYKFDFVFNSVKTEDMRLQSLWI